MATPSVGYRTCTVPRAGGEADDYEDAAAVEATDWPVCAAVADGATESVFARAWAERLVREIVEARATTAEAVREAIAEGQVVWQASARERSRDRPWYVAAKATEGAFATVLGLSLHADGRWRAVSVGDCCLFHVRDDALVHPWPVESADDFTNRPPLVPSRSDRRVPAPEMTDGPWRPGDRFLLATDAVAAWLLRTEDAAARHWDSESFRAAVDTARDDGALRNDDATLLVLDSASSPQAAG